MSLALSCVTSHGIVMASDQRITMTADDGRIFGLPLTTQKLFLAPNGYGFSTVGTLFIKTKPVSAIMEGYIQEISKLGLSIKDSVEKLCTDFHDLDPTADVQIIGSGYESGNPSVFSSSSATPNELTDQLATTPHVIAAQGELGLAQAIAGVLPLSLNMFSLADAVDFVRHMISSASNIQKFSTCPQTISPDCDILLIRPDHSEWVSPPPYAIS